MGMGLWLVLFCGLLAGWSGSAGAMTDPNAAVEEPASSSNPANEPEAASSPQPESPPRELVYPIDDPLGLAKSCVVDVFSEYAVRGSKVHNLSIRHMITLGMTRLTGQATLEQAWHCFMDEADVVALVFTRLGSDQLATNKGLASALLQLLYESGYEPEQFMIIGLDTLPEEARGTRPVPYGWQSEVIDFGCGQVRLAKWLDEVTVIINVPTIMDDNTTGIRGALTNMCWPVIMSPADFYLNRGDPFVPEIARLAPIRSKYRLHIGNALRVLYRGGPAVELRYTEDRRSLLFATDPVAMDRVALELIRKARRSHCLSYSTDQPLNTPILKTAELLGIGYYDLNMILYRYLDNEEAMNEAPLVGSADG